MKKLLLLISLSIFIFFDFTYAQVIDTERGKVEFVGLNKWSVDELVDTLRSISPNQSLHACAADLRYKLGFADASAIGYFDNGDIYTVITVIESQDKLFIKYLDEPSDSLEAVSDWNEGIELFENDFQGFNIAIQNYGRALFDDRKSAKENLPDWINLENVERVWDFLLNHNSRDDMNLALWILNSDKNYKNRVIATSILANFSEYDLTWWTLLDNMRYPDARVAGTSEAVIISLFQTNPKVVNWKPALHSIQHILRGTNLFAYNTVLTVLPKTGLNRELAEVLLGDEQIQKLLRSYLEAEFKRVHEYGQEFLSSVYDKTDEESNWQEVLDYYLIERN